MLKQAGKPWHSLGHHSCVVLSFKQGFSPLLFNIHVLSSPSAFHFEIWFCLTLKCKGNNLGLKKNNKGPPPHSIFRHFCSIKPECVFFHSKPQTVLSLLKPGLAHVKPSECLQTALWLEKFRPGLPILPQESPKFVASTAGAFASPNTAPSWLEPSCAWLGQRLCELLPGALKLESTSVFMERGGLPLPSLPLPLNSTLSSRSD